MIKDNQLNFDDKKSPLLTTKVIRDFSQIQNNYHAVWGAFYDSTTLVCGNTNSH